LGREKNFTFPFHPTLGIFPIINKMKKILIILIPIYYFILSDPIYTQQKIISLTPSITESLYLLEEKDNVVGITTFCRRISKKQKVVGTYLEPNIEEIIKLNPDVVFISKEGTRKEIVDTLEKFKIKVIAFEPANSFDDIKKQFLDLAKLLNKQKKAELIINEYEKKLLKLKKKKSKKVLCVLGLQPIVIASDRSYIGDIIKFAGGENVVKSDLKYPQVNIEEILKLKPEVIISPSMGESKEEIIKFFSAYRNIPAVENKKIFVFKSNILCQPTIKNFYTATKEIYNKLNE